MSVRDLKVPRTPGSQTKIHYFFLHVCEIASVFYISVTSVRSELFIQD